MTYDNLIKGDVQKALLNDTAFSFRQSGNNLRHGICPNCGEKECFVNLDNPWRVSCGRLNNCEWSATTRELYPEIFENFSKRFPATQENPTATADAYMQHNRGFDLGIIKGMYLQGNAKNQHKEEYYPSVKVIIDQKCYWQRIIDSEHVRANGDKAKIVGDYKGTGWIPPGMTFERNDEVWLTEAIFKTMAFLHLEKPIKSIASLSSSNFPGNIIKANLNKDITWVIAQDNDTAGIKAAKKFKAKIENLGETVKIAFPEKGEDWDDAFRSNKLTEKYINKSFWRAYYLLADTPQKKAFFKWAGTKFKEKDNNDYPRRLKHFVFEFNNFLYSCEVTIDSVEKDEIEDYLSSGFWSIRYIEIIGKMLPAFVKISEIKKISNCLPNFLYEQENVERKTNCYMIEIRSGYGNKTRIVELNPKAISSPTDFSANLTSSGSGFTFDGTKRDLKFIKDNWFNRRLRNLEVIDFIGYSDAYEAYVFPDFGFKDGKILKKVNNDYIASESFQIKTTLKSIEFIFNEKFDPFWFEDFKAVYHYNGLVLMSWWIGSLFADQIKKRQSSYPWLELTGDPGTGKTSLIKFMWKLCGRTKNYEGFDVLKDNAKAWDRQFKQVGNMPVVLVEGDREESKSSSKPTKKLDLNMFKNTYDHQGLLRGTAKADYTNETNTFPFRGTMMISQNAQIDGDRAVLERICYFHSTKEHHFEGGDKIIDRFKEMPVKKVCGFLTEILKREKEFVSYYYSIYPDKKSFFMRNGVKDTRIAQNYAQICSCLWLLPKIFKNRITEKECLSIQDYLLKKAIEREKRLGGDHPLVEQFWNYYEDINYVYNRNTAYNTKGTAIEEYVKVDEILNHSINKEYIAINLTHFEGVMAEKRLQKLDFEELKKRFPKSKRHKFVANKTVSSSIDKIRKRCWVFKKGSNPNNSKVKKK